MTTALLDPDAVAALVVATGLAVPLIAGTLAAVLLRSLR